MNWLQKQSLPFLVEQYQGRYVAFKEDRSGFVNADCPYVTRLQGLPVEQWLDAIRPCVTAGSAQLIHLTSVRDLRYYGIFSRKMGLASAKTVQVEFESEDRSNQTVQELSFCAKRPMYGCWPKTESGIVDGSIGYLRLAPFMDFQPAFQDQLIEQMNAFKETKGLIIDVRGNGGGARTPLVTLFPYFMKPDDEPHIVNVAVYRTGIGREEGDERFTLRNLYPADSPDWTDAERRVISQHAQQFQPQWQPPAGQFSPWHYFVISPVAGDSRYYYYDKPVVILMESWNFSACDIFLGAFKGWRNVTLVGTPSGGGSGSAVSYRLAHSDIKIKLSSMASFRANGMLYDGNGIQPDVYCEPIPTDAIGQTDTQLDKAKEILRKKIS